MRLLALAFLGVVAARALQGLAPVGADTTVAGGLPIPTLGSSGNSLSQIDSADRASCSEITKALEPPRTQDPTSTDLGPLGGDVENLVLTGCDDRPETLLEGNQIKRALPTKAASNLRSHQAVSHSAPVATRGNLDHHHRHHVGRGHPSAGIHPMPSASRYSRPTETELHGHDGAQSDRSAHPEPTGRAA